VKSVRDSKSLTAQKNNAPHSCTDVNMLLRFSSSNITSPSLSLTVHSYTCSLSYLINSAFSSIGAAQASVQHSFTTALIYYVTSASHQQNLKMGLVQSSSSKESSCWVEHTMSIRARFSPRRSVERGDRFVLQRCDSRIVIQAEDAVAAVIPTSFLCASGQRC
jgi:hypothetical protein